MNKQINKTNLSAELSAEETMEQKISSDLQWNSYRDSISRQKKN